MNMLLRTTGLLCLMAMLLIAQPVLAQRGDRPNAPSPNAKVSQTIGSTEVDMHFSRPGAKGRTLFGEGGIIPFNTVWRAGANEPTSITFSSDVMIEGQALAAGEYALWFVPRAEGGWMVIFGSMVGWGTQYSEANDALRVDATPMEGPHQEWMSYTFEDLTSSSATLVMRWGTTMVPIKITV